MQVEVRKGKFETALRIFKRKVSDSEILKEVRDRQFYEKPSIRRHRKKRAAEVRERKRSQSGEFRPPFKRR